jgi:hypothetical protein
VWGCRHGANGEGRADEIKPVDAGVEDGNGVDGCRIGGRGTRSAGADAAALEPSVWPKPAGSMDVGGGELRVGFGGGGGLLHTGAESGERGSADGVIARVRAGSSPQKAQRTQRKEEREAVARSASWKFLEPRRK